MQDETANQLRRLNREFYDQYAQHFAESRSSFPDGILRSLQWLSDAPSFLDVGCGDGRVGRALLRQRVPNTVTRYVGVDFSRELLEQPTEAENPFPAGFELELCDLVSTEWAAGKGEVVNRAADEQFEAAVCLAVLFHIPGEARRRRVVDGLYQRLVPSGRAVFSVWQFLHVPRIQRKILDWSELGLQASDLEPGDLLLDWWRGGRGLRYVHHFDEAEITRLLESSGFLVEDTFRSDGATGDMSLFVKVRKPSAPSTGL